MPLKLSYVKVAKAQDGVLIAFSVLGRYHMGPTYEIDDREAKILRDELIKLYPVQGCNR